MLGSKLALFLLAAAFVRGCDSKIVVDPVPNGTSAPANGVVYALPNTVVRVQLKLDRTERVGARFAPFATIFAPAGTAVCKVESCDEEKKLSFSLQDSATFATYGEPDPNQVYMVKFAGGRTIDQTLSMTWTDTGLLTAASATVTNRTGDVALSALKVAAGLGTKAFGGGPDREATACPDEQSDNDAWVLPILRVNDVVGPTLVENYCAMDKKTRDALNRAREPLLKEAVAAYVNRVQPLIVARTQILSGQSRTAEPAALLSHIESAINEQLAVLYLGTKKTQTWDGALDVRELAEGTPLTVLKIHPTAGVCLTDKAVVPPTIKPLPPKFIPTDSRSCGDAAPVNLRLDYYPRRDYQLFTKIAEVSAGDRSFRYRLAAQVMAELSDAKSKYGTGVFSVAQLGKVISLPASRRSKTLTYELAFIESTGALRSFKLNSVGMLDAATVDALGGVAGTLIDARKTEVEALTQQLQLLKLKDDICTIQKKYNLPCTVEPQ